EKPVLMGLSHALPEAVPHESPLYRYVAIPEERAQIGQVLKQDGLFIFIGYVSVPLDLWKAVHGAGATAAWIVSPLPGDADFRQFGDTVIDQHWQIGDAAVIVPGYDIRILPPSGILQLVVFDTLMAVAENPGTAPRMPDAKPAGISAVHTDRPVVVDGRLDDPVWTTAPAYALSAVPGTGGARPPLQEGGAVRFAWDDRYLYIALEFTDSDVVAEGSADGLYQYRLGDVGEIFLKPSGATHYWEFYVTPKGRQTTFYYPSRGRLLLPSSLLATNDLVVAAQVQGTLNDYRDRDRGWTAEMAVPIAMLTAQGDIVGPGSRWTVQAGRYNYSAYLPAMELSSMPALSQGNFHLVEEFAPLRFDPAPPLRQTPR
ncbi:MAG: hypothetical protein JWM35_2654, partial [Verrucomicrobia bacterium]|nr:hypothetical protein [Verrucomicrobiota bacterium]